MGLPDVVIVTTIAFPPPTKRRAPSRLGASTHYLLQYPETHGAIAFRCALFVFPKTQTTNLDNDGKKKRKTLQKQADAFSLPDDENENENEDDGDDSEFVYEKITLLTADGVVVLPGRKIRRSSLDGGSVRARWRREADERRRREQREARRSGRGSFPVVPPSAERSAAVRALEATLPGTWARGSAVSAAAAAASSGEVGAPSSSSSSSPSGLLVFASPFAVSASNGVDRGCVSCRRCR